MKRLVCLTAMALLGIGLLLAQNTKPSSDASNSSNSSSQTQSGTAPQQGEETQVQTPGAKHRQRDHTGQSTVPDPTVRDQQNSTTSNTGVSGQTNNPASRSTMGTTGSTPATPEQSQPSTTPQNGTSPDQQPNATAPAPHAYLLQTPAARAAATHTPDPGTCMNPAVLQTNADGSQPVAPRCR